MALPASDDAPRVVEPGEEALDFPAAARAPEGSAVLGARAAAPVRSDHFDAVGLAEMLIERVTVVPAVADQARREVREEPRVEGGADEVAFIR